MLVSPRPARAPVRSSLPGALAVGAVSLALAGLVDAVIRHESHPTGDEPFYERMASHPGAPHSYPYAYRVAVPWLVHVLPFSHVVSFTLISLVAIGVASGALYALIEEFDVPAALAGALCIGFALSPTLLVVLPRHGVSVDPASVLVMVLGCLFIVRGQRGALAVTVLIGVAVKESSLFLLPLAYAVWAERLIDPEALRDTLLVSLAPVAAYVGLRAAVDAVGNSYTPAYTGSFFHVRLDVIRQGLHWVEFRRVAYAYGPLWLVAPFALRDLRFARRGLVLVVLCVISMTYSFDLGRIIFLAAPVFYVSSAWVLRNRPQLAAVTVAALLAVDIGYAAYLQAYGVAHGLDTTVNHQIPVR